MDDHDHDPAVTDTLIDALTADLDPDAAAELAAELTRMIALGILDLEDGDEDPPRVVIAPPPPDQGEGRAVA